MSMRCIRPHRCLSAILLAGLAGCTSGLENAAREELKANPAAGTNVAALHEALQQAEPGPLIPGTSTPAPVPLFKAAALANPDVDAPVADAVAIRTAQQQAALATPAMPSLAAPDAVTLLPATAGDAELPEDVAAPQTPLAPTPKPGGALAYAAPSGNAARAFDLRFDTSPPSEPPVPDTSATSGPTVLNSLIRKYAEFYEIPESLVHRVVHRESRYNPAAFNRGHYGLMQIKYATAKSMGYDGPANGLFDAENNLKYSIKYLKGAWLVADKSEDGAVRLYARGYYYDAKRKGMLHVLN